MPTCRNFDVFLQQAMNSIPIFFFFRYCKDIPNLLLWVLWESLIMTTNNDITLQKTLMHKVLKSTCGKLWCLSPCKISTSPKFFFDILQGQCKLPILGTLGSLKLDGWTFLSKTRVSICSKLLCLSACNKTT